MSTQGRQDKTPLGRTDQNYYDLVSSTRKRLASRRGDIIAKRGIRLIDTMLSVGSLTSLEQTPAYVRNGQTLGQGMTTDVTIDLQKIVAHFLAGDAARTGLFDEGSGGASASDSPPDIDLVDVDFDTWFESLFRA